MNAITLIDGYKVDHRRQYPAKTQFIFSNFTPRKTRRKNTDKVVFFGLQYFIKKYLIQNWNDTFFKQPKEKVIAAFSRRINNYLGPNSVGTQHVSDLHDLGYLPVEIWALPEGTRYNLRVPSFVIFNTDSRFFWLTNYLETIASTTIWGPCTSATTAAEYRILLNKFALETTGSTDFVQWQGHDFSFRGMFGLEAACMSGAGHLLSFTGTDTIPAIDFLEEYYNANAEKELIGGSVAATEHSVASTLIGNVIEKYLHSSEQEQLQLADIDYISYLLDLYPTGIVSIVSDTFDYWNTITNTARILKNKILARNGKVVFRPDTGDPVKIVCGDPDATTEHERKGSIEVLWDIFGGTVTPQGYKVLNNHTGLIYGDSIFLERAQEICEKLKAKGFASTNIVFGIGSYTYQYVTRDTDSYAVKATFAIVDGKSIDIYKKPKTDDGTKFSAKGLTAVYEKDGEFFLKDQATMEEVKNCAFVKVFSNSTITKDWTLNDIRARLTSYIQ